MGIDVDNFYLSTHLDDPEYMWLPRWIFPPEFILAHNLEHLFVNDRILTRINKGMYGLPQSGRLAYIQLIKHLQKHGYVRTGVTPGLFRHVTRKTIFSLVVDDFGIKYTKQEDAQHLIDTLEKAYSITINWKGAIFLGLHLKWDYTNQTVEISMPGYILKALIRFHHKFIHAQDSPHHCARPNYGAKIQYANPITNTTLTTNQLKHAQQVIGVFLFYARAIDSTMLSAIGSIATNLSTDPWTETQKKHHPTP